MKAFYFLLVSCIFVACNLDQNDLTIEKSNSINQSDDKLVEIDEFINNVNELGNIIMNYSPQEIEIAYTSLIPEKQNTDNYYFIQYMSNAFDIEDELLEKMKNSYAAIQISDPEILNLKIRDRYKERLALRDIQLKNYNQEQVSGRACSCGDLAFDLVTTTAIAVVACGSCAEGLFWTCPGCVASTTDVYNIGVQMVGCGCFS